ncbi:hypothetical protein EDC14_102541 [Hydrogenispora ethanolica]|uniref:Uncharacterized protein n=1 Tax=Hydrogenispora ethanolica TaxID=1082276 RepID=A0A4R1RAJ1_HYDET|nr:hypothetical protein [Hydrogenispora ethanolica]TCL62422.1 hypothetical protein EDC14_102541 [Hydrogenispora ethanolica]
MALMDGLLNRFRQWKGRPLPEIPLKTAGWVAILSGIYFGLARIWLLLHQDPSLYYQFSFARALLGSIPNLITVYLLGTLLKLLDRQGRSRSVSPYIKFFIGYNLLELVAVPGLGIANFTLLRADVAFRAKQLLPLVLAVALASGAISILYGLKLRKLAVLPGERHLWFYAYAMLAAGIAWAFMITYWVGSVLWYVSWIFLGCFFLGAACADLSSGRNPERESAPAQRAVTPAPLNRAVFSDADRQAEKAFDQLTFDAYLQIRNEVTRYLPRCLSEPEIKQAILAYLKKTGRGS